MTDLFILWRIDILYSALIVSVFGFVILGITAYETLPKVKNWSVTVILLFITLSSIPHQISYSLKSIVREPNTELISTEISPYGDIFIHKKFDQYRFSINHSEIFKYPDSNNIQETVHTALLQYPWAESVLVIGEWKEIIDEILRYPNIKNIYWSNPVPGIFDAISRIASTDLKLNQYEKVRIMKNTDPRLFLKKIKNKKIFDIVFVSLPDPTNVFLNRFYTHEFYQELKSVIGDNSMIAITLKTGEKNLGDNRQMLSATVYHTLKRTFPNTLEMYGTNSNILASHNRNFTTAHLALLEFINVLKSIPDYISPSLLRYKINSRKLVKEQLNISGVPVNLDSKPASLKYSFNRLVLTFGIFPNFIIKTTNNINSFIIYIVILLFTVVLIKFFYRTSLSKKIKLITIILAFIFGMFFYDLIVFLQITCGQIYKLVSVILLVFIIGMLLSKIYLRNKDPKTSLSYIRKFLMITGLFLLIIPTVFEIRFNHPELVFILIFSIIGGFLFNGNISMLTKIYLNLKEKAAEQLPKLWIHIMLGLVLACFGCIFILPIMGTIELLPVLGILSIGCVFIIII